MFCPKCGKQVANDSLFCDECGAKIEMQSPVTMPAEVPMSNRAEAQPEPGINISAQPSVEPQMNIGVQEPVVTSTNISVESSSIKGDVVKKKKSKKLPVIIISLVLAAALAAAAAVYYFMFYKNSENLFLNINLEMTKSQVINTLDSNTDLTKTIEGDTATEYTVASKAISLGDGKSVKCDKIRVQFDGEKIDSVLLYIPEAEHDNTSKILKEVYGDEFKAEENNGDKDKTSDKEYSVITFKSIKK